ncbi:hydrogenase [Paradesulfitobacterium ferrireducens]|uniref:hydrogenase n=1 Tax=Paradesulfitobacterium ferrireducens TaxID=2816476 RepID=UPI001A8F8411|nr:hydrogenase [Paradesulfitobacterium ferrireducens]
MALGNYLGAVNFLITLILGTCFAVLGSRRMETVIKLAVAQALLLAGLSIVLGWATGIGEMYVAALLTLAVKAGVIPYILTKVVRGVGVSREVNSYVSLKMSFLIAGALVIVSYLATGQIVGRGSGLVHEALPAAVAMILMGLFVIMTRKLAVMQITGFLLMENGISLAGLGTTNGMPLVVELGIFLDILIGVLIMGVLAFRINRTFDTLDTENLRNLRG